MTNLSKVLCTFSQSKTNASVSSVQPPQTTPATHSRTYITNLQSKDYIMHSMNLKLKKNLAIELNISNGGSRGYPGYPAYRPTKTFLDFIGVLGTFGKIRVSPRRSASQWETLDPPLVRILLKFTGIFKPW